MEVPDPRLWPSERLSTNTGSPWISDLPKQEVVNGWPWKPVKLANVLQGSRQKGQLLAKVFVIGGTTREVKM